MNKPSAPDTTFLQQANIALLQGDIDNAITLYQQAARQRPVLAHSIAFIIAYLEADKTGEALAAHWQTLSAAAQDFTSLNDPLVSELSVDLTQDLEVGFDMTALALAVNMEVTAAGNWQALSADPYFILDIADLAIDRGFYLLEFEMVVEQPLLSLSTKLYADYGAGFNEQDATQFIVVPGKKASRWVFFEKKVNNLRFDPAEHSLTFTVKNFRLKHHSMATAIHSIEQFLIEKSVTLPVATEEYHVNLYRYYDQLLKQNTANLSYEEWIYHKEKCGFPTEAQITESLKQYTYKPVFSVVMPTYNTDEVYLRECIESVLNQSYPYFELCIADDNSPKPHVIKILDEYAARDPRVKVVKRKENGHISLATNSAIAITKGDYIALLDHDDLLAEHALYFMAEAINRHPNGQVFYSDEDKIDLDGRRSAPHFKSDWNPDLFFSQNYVSHLGVYRASLIKMIGGFRVGVEGSQDQDLLLRCLPYVNHNEIHHIPRVLYHWRMLEGSTALASGEKSYTTEAGVKALTDYFTANGPKGVTVQAGVLPNTYKVNWPIPAKAPKVSLLIPTRDRKAITEVAVRSILEKTTYPNYEIVILDNGSVETETLAFFKQIQQEDSRVSVLQYDYPFNYSAINNFGVKHTDGELVGLINNDIEVINPEWLTEMVSHAIRPDIGCVGAKLYYSNDLIQHAGVIIGLGGVANHSHKMFPRYSFGYFGRLVCNQNLSAVTAAVLIVRREIYNNVKGLNEQELKVAFNDVDFCLKVRKAGYRNLWTPYAELYHHESISRGSEDTPEKVVRFQAEIDYMKNTWQDELKLDPYYSPNLTKDRVDFSIGVEF